MVHVDLTHIKYLCTRKQTITIWQIYRTYILSSLVILCTTRAIYRIKGIETFIRYGLRASNVGRGTSLVPRFIPPFRPLRELYKNPSMRMAT